MLRKAIVAAARKIIGMCGIFTSTFLCGTAHASSDYRDLVYQTYLSTGSAPYTLYVQALPKQLQLHFQAGMPDVPLQQYPLEPTASATFAGNCVQASVSLAATTNLSSAALAGYAQTGLHVHGDWNSDGQQDMLLLGPTISCSGSSTILLLELTNQGYTTPPVVKVVPVNASTWLGWLLQQWQSGAVTPEVLDMLGNGHKQSLAFSTNLLNPTGNPDMLTVTPDGNGLFTADTGTLTLIQTGDYTPPEALPDVTVRILHRSCRVPWVQPVARTRWVWMVQPIIPFRSPFRRQREEYSLHFP